MMVNNVIMVMNRLSKTLLWHSIINKDDDDNDDNDDYDDIDDKRIASNIIISIKLYASG